jgi:hypothetical protein
MKQDISVSKSSIIWNTDHHEIKAATNDIRRKFESCYFQGFIRSLEKNFSQLLITMKQDISVSYTQIRNIKEFKPTLSEMPSIFIIGVSSISYNILHLIFPACHLDKISLVL